MWARKPCSLLVWILIFFSSVFLFQPTEVRAEDPPTDVYVDDDFENDSENHKYKKIQDGINNVSVNGTVHVYEGIYVENLHINKSLNLIGNSSSNTTIDGKWIPYYYGPIAIKVVGGAVVNISGFNITESESDQVIFGVYVIENSTVSIKECRFENMGHAVVAEMGGILHVENNSFYREKNFPEPIWYAIAVSIRPWHTGVTGNGAPSTVVNNTIVFDEYGWGIHVEKSAISLIENNTVIQNNSEWVCDNYGLDHSGAIVLYQHGAIGSSTIRSNSLQGFCFGVSTEGVNAMVENNTVSGCRRCITSAAFWKEPRHPSNITVTNNTITSFTEHGLFVCNNKSYMKASNNNITGLSTGLGHGATADDTGRLDFGPNNTVSNSGIGVLTTYRTTFTTANENVIFGTGEGFHSEGNDNIHHNEFYSNDEGIRVQGNANREISNNTIVGSHKRAGIWIYGSSNNKKIWFNEISQGYRGIWITGASGNNDIKWNNISDNDYGIHLEAITSASPNLLEENNVSFGDYGIYIDQSDKIAIQNNDIANNYESGIYISDSEFINITRNNITNNYIGIDVHSSNTTLVNDTSIIGNVLWAINATDYVDATDNYFGTSDSFRIDKLVSENVDYTNPLLFRDSGVNITEGDRYISSDTVFPKGQIINGSLTVNSSVNITFTNQTGHNFIQVNGEFVIVNGSFLKAAHGNFTILATNGSFSNLTNARFEKQMGIGIQTTNMLVMNCTFANGTAGIVVNRGGSNNIQHSNFISNSRYGVYLFGSTNNTIQDNFIAMSRNGIQAYNSSLDSLSWNNISANDRGIKVTYSSYASIHNNTITNNYVGIEIRTSLYTNVNNNSIVGNVLLAILDGTFSLGTNAHYNYFGTNSSSQIDKLCEGVSCSNWINHTHPDFDYIYGNATWSTTQNLTRGVIVYGNLTVAGTQVHFNNSLHQNFIQVNGMMEISSSQLEGNQGRFTILHLHQSSGWLNDSTLDNFRGVGVQSASGFLTNNSTFNNGTYGMTFWRAKHSQVSNSTFESNVEWSIGFFSSDQNNIETSRILNSSIGVYIYASDDNTIHSNEISNNPIGTWLESFRLSIMFFDPASEFNNISSNEFYNNDIGVLATTYSASNVVSSNVFSSNSSGIGVELSGMSQYMNLDSNTFKDNEYGVLISDYSTRNEVDSNTFTNNDHSVEISSRFQVHPSYVTNNVVTANNISLEWGNAYGIRVYDSEFNLIRNNTISTTSGPTGILIEYSDNNTFLNNSVTSSSNAGSGRGVRLRYAGGNNLSKNTIAGFRYNFGVEGEKLWDFVQDIDSNNTVDGRRIYYWVNENGNNGSYNSDGGYYGFVNSTYMTVRNVSQIKYNLQGFLFAYSSHIFLQNASTEYASYGAELYRSDHITIEDLNASWGVYGIYVNRSSKNVIANSSSWKENVGIRLSYSNNNVLSNVTSAGTVAPMPRPGIGLEYSSYNLITNNTTVSDSRPGIQLESGGHNTISFADVTRISSDSGIKLIATSTNTITRCNITSSSWGIWGMSSHENTISNNSITHNGRGIYLVGSENNMIVNNDISNNSQYGVYLSGSFNKVILNNITNNNQYGVEIHGGMKNDVHHNNFICNKGDCYDGYQGYDVYVSPTNPGNSWDNDTVGNFWTLESWGINGGRWTTYWVDYDEAGTIRDNHPQWGSFLEAGPQY